MNRVPFLLAVAVRDDHATWFASHQPGEDIGGTSDVTVITGEETEGEHYRHDYD